MNNLNQTANMLEESRDHLISTHKRKYSIKSVTPSFADMGVESAEEETISGFDYHSQSNYGRSPAPEQNNVPKLDVQSLNKKNTASFSYLPSIKKFTRGSLLRDNSLSSIKGGRNSTFE
jgi:hypothetical protein